MTPLEETNKTPITDPEIEFYEVSDKEFRIMFLKNFQELQENTDKQLNEISKVMHVQNEKFNNKIETIKKQQHRNPRVK